MNWRRRKKANRSKMVYIRYKKAYYFKKSYTIRGFCNDIGNDFIDKNITSVLTNVKVRQDQYILSWKE